MPGTDTMFDAREYWRQRIAGDGALSNVGQAELGDYNRYTYPLRLDAFERALEGLVPDHPRVFDGGFGEGVYLRYWAERGASIVAGLDFSPRAVKSGRRAHPTFDLHTGDLAKPEDLRDFGRYDVVTAIDVLYHVVDDDAWRSAVGNLLHLTSPSGVFLFTDKLPREGAYQPMAHVRRRSLAMWEEALAEHGFQVIKRVPVFMLMDDPITCGNRPWLGRMARLQWRLATKLIRMTARWPRVQNRVAGLVARLQLPFERAMVQRMDAVPNLEILVCRRAP